LHINLKVLLSYFKCNQTITCIELII